ncbi:MAG: sensor histidine kinase [Romboutsia sp.]|uniref:sensor histidine kinase n=1 Tax=Romboutsia sp. TaxID=1965302 RepID=UPI003F2C8CDE
MLDYNIRFILLFLVSTLLFVLCEILVLRNLDLEKLDYVLSSINILIPISMFILLIGKNYSFFYVLNFSRHSLLVSAVFLASSLLEFYFGAFMIIAISKSYNLSIYKHKNEILNMQYDLQVNNLNQLEECQSDIRRISHDIHNHKIIIYNLIQNKDYDEALMYLDKFGSGFSNNTYEVFTNHKILNALFLKKKDVCTNYNVNFNIDINIPEKINISDFDLCIIIGNLVDNALEACKRIDASDVKYIHIKSKIINNNFIFEIKNNFNGSINIDKEKILTSKKNKLNHGLGLTNVKSTISKYEGNCNLSFKDNEFTSLVMIPLN